MRLTNDMRVEALNKMVNDAVAKHADTVCGLFKKANDGFWAHYTKDAEYRSGVVSARWGDMVRLGMMATRATVEPVVLEGEGDHQRWQDAATNEHSKAQREVLVHLRADPRWSMVKKMTDTRYYSRKDVFRFRFHSDTPMPVVYSAERRSDDCPHVAALRKAADTLELVCVAAAEFKAKCETVLWAAKTRRQLEELMPSALKYFPTPAVEQKMPMPVAQAKELATALEVGVPQEVL